MTAAAFDPRNDLVRLQLGESNTGPLLHPLDFDNDDISTGSVTLSNTSTPRPKPSEQPPTDDIPEEECWLFKPAKSSKQPSFLSNTSCLQWAREIFDSPTSEFYHHRRDLIHRLEAILTTQPAKRLGYIGGSVPSLNMTANSAVTPAPLSRFRGGGSGQNFAPGSTATFTRPKRQTSEILPQHTRQGSSPSGNRSPGRTVKNSGSTDDLHNVADLQTIARKQEDDLKAEVAAISAQQHATRLGSSQQSLNSANAESPYSSQTRLNISSSPTPSDIAKQQMAVLRLSLDNPRPAFRVGSEEDVMGGSGEANIQYRPFPSPPPLPSTRYGPSQSPFTAPPPPPLADTFIPPEGQQAVIVGRPTRIGSRLPGPMRKPGVDKGPRFHSNEALPSYGWGDGPAVRQTLQRRIPVPAPRGSQMGGGI